MIFILQKSDEHFHTVEEAIDSAASLFNVSSSSESYRSNGAVGHR
jgi:hypothetical protein